MILKENEMTFEEKLYSILDDIDNHLNNDVLMKCISERLNQSLQLYDIDTDHSVANLELRGFRKVVKEAGKQMKRKYRSKKRRDNVDGE